MKTSLECVYKGIKEIKAGSFVNEKGHSIEFPTYYKIRFDQIINGLPKETEFKLNKELALNTAKNLSIYDNIVINFNVVIYTNKNIFLQITDIKKI